MSQYLLSSSHTWISEEQSSALNSTITSTYVTLQLKERQETIKIEEYSSGSGDEGETLNSSSEPKNEKKLSKTNHLKLYADKNRYKCKECDKMFTRGGSLKRHMIIHTGEKPYKCKECDKMFTHSGNLNTHMIRQTGDKP